MLDSAGRFDGSRSNDENGALRFGLLLRRYRRTAGLSQEALAERASLSPDAIGMLERGVRRAPYEQTVERLALALGLGQSERRQLWSSIRRKRRASKNGTRRATLPAPLTPLIGRERDVAIVRSWFATDGSRLVTITGPSGVGKTRFALAVAGDLRHQFDDVAFVNLALVDNPGHIARAILAGFDRARDGPNATVAMLCSVVADRRVLFVVDNFEHVLAAGPVLCEFLERCSSASVLVTSREALRVRGEREFSLGPLELDAAVELLLERGQAVQRHLEIDRTGDALKLICKRLDCLPLAIELAAPRLRHESVHALLERLSSPLSALVFGPRDAPVRQRTMRAAIDWGFQLLDDAEQTLFCICSLFASGGSLDALRAIVGATESFAGDASSVLASLADKHLLKVFDASSREMRFEMLEVIREYARERFDSLALADAYARAFVEYFTKMVSGPIERTTREYANVRAALDWCVGHDRSLGLRLAVALPPLWERTGLYAESRKWLEALTEPLDETIAREDPTIAWRTLNALGLSYYWTADPAQGCRVHERALALARATGDLGTASRSLNNLGIALLDAGEPDRARRALEESLEIKERRDDSWSIGSTVGNLGIALRMCGEYERALTCHHRARDLFGSIGYAWGEIGELNFIGDVYRDRNENEEAASYYVKSLEANVEEIRPSVAHSLEGLLTIAARCRDYRRAALLGGAIDRIWRETGQSESPSTVAHFERTCVAARAFLGDPSFEETWREGASLPLPAVIRASVTI